MGKAEWFAEYERLWNEYDDKTEDELADMATEAMIDRVASQIDAARDRAKYEPQAAVPAHEGSRAED